MSNLGKEHWVATKRILWYIKTSFTLGIMCGTFSQPSTRIGRCDSNWVGNLDNQKSNTGYFFQNVRSLISWQLKKQSNVVLSRIEVEYMVVANVIKEAIWLQKLVFNFGFSPLQSIPFIAINSFYCNIQSCIKLVENPNFHERSKHIAICYHFIQEQVNQNTSTYLLQYYKNACKFPHQSFNQTQA
jgi:hypothetical protein